MGGRYKRHRRLRPRLRRRFRRRVRRYRAFTKGSLRTMTLRGLFPPQLHMKCHASSQWMTNTANAGFQAVIQVKLNSLTSPFTHCDATGGPYLNSATAYQQLVGANAVTQCPYNVYLVYGCKLSIQLMNAGANAVILYTGYFDPVSTNGVVAPTVITAGAGGVKGTWNLNQNLPWRETVIGSNNAMDRPYKVVSRYFDIPKCLGIPREQYFTSSGNQGGTVTNPLTTYFWNSRAFLSTYSALGATALNYRIHCTYYCRFLWLNRTLMPPP